MNSLTQRWVIVYVNILWQYYSHQACHAFLAYFLTKVEPTGTRNLNGCLQQSARGEARIPTLRKFGPEQNDALPPIDAVISVKNTHHIPGLIGRKKGHHIFLLPKIPSPSFLVRCSILNCTPISCWMQQCSIRQFIHDTRMHMNFCCFLLFV